MGTPTVATGWFESWDKTPVYITGSWGNSRSLMLKRNLHGTYQQWAIENKDIGDRLIGHPWTQYDTRPI